MLITTTGVIEVTYFKKSNLAEHKISINNEIGTIQLIEEIGILRDIGGRALTY